MPMRWDPLLVSAVARELNGLLEGARVRALHLDAESRRLVLFLEQSTLVFELHPLAGWLSMLSATEPWSDARPFRSTVVEVRAPLDESALVISLRPRRREAESVEIVIELVGNRWNALALAGRHRTIRHTLVSRPGGSRPLVVGSPYAFPAYTNRLGRDRSIPSAAWDEVVGTRNSDSSTSRKAILHRIAWTSSLNVDLFLGEEGWNEWHRVVDPKNWSAYVTADSRGLQPYPVPRTSGLEGPQCSSLIEALRIIREDDPDATPAPGLLAEPSLVMVVEKRLRSARRRNEGLERELSRRQDPESLRPIGDLILARYSDIPPGVDRVTLESFDGTQLEVALDPALSPSENAARYYRRAAKAKRARKSLPERISQASDEVRKWSQLLSDIRTGALDPTGLERALGPLPEPRSRTPQSAAALPYRSFRSTGGREIRVGRGARRNDDLTFHHSRPMDIWLHTRQAPGAHVILRWEQEGSPPRQDLAEAAALAALHSPARHSKRVAVGWTRRKYVRKPRRAPPGTVAPERLETVFVQPDPTLLERLSVVD